MITFIKIQIQFKYILSKYRSNLDIQMQYTTSNYSYQDSRLVILIFNILYFKKNLFKVYNSVMTDTNLLSSYQAKNFNTLASANLRQPIDNEGNTIVHLMAKNLDREGFEKLLSINPKSVTDELINAPNNNSQRPIHLAMQSIQSNNDPSKNQFIEYLIYRLGANPSIPDNNNRIVKQKSEATFESNQKLQKLNNDTISNLRIMNNLIEKEKNNIVGHGDVDFVRKLTEHYKTKYGVSQTGGYNGQRKIRYESDRNDSFVLDKNTKNKLYNDKSANEYDIRRDIWGSNNNRQAQKSFDDDWNTDDFDLEESEDDMYDIRRINQNKRSTHYDMYTPDRPRDEKVDEVYRSFVKKIMDLLGVDEETARKYRSAIKLNIEEKNPELRGRINDSLKVKEMEKIFENKNRLQQTLDSIDMGAIQEIIEKRKTESETRRAERNKDRSNRNRSDRNSDRPSKNEGTRGNRGSKGSSGSKGSNGSSGQTETEKPKRTRKSSAAPSRVNNGYLESDEIIFSSEDEMD